MLASLRTIFVVLCLVLLTACGGSGGDSGANNTDDTDSTANTGNETVLPNPNPNGISIEGSVTYGQAMTQNGRLQDLQMDLYLPNDNNTARNLVLLAHGGGFTGGTREEMGDLASDLAEAGYVAASISYRLMDVEPTREAYFTAVAQATTDMKSAIRYLRANAAGANTYGINPDNIVVGGYSAGAVTALHAAYINAENEIPVEMAAAIAVEGGLNGGSHTAYSSAVKGVMNIAGGIVDLALLDSGDPQLMSIHGTADEVVPYLSGDADNSGVTLYGSGLMHPRLEELGEANTLLMKTGVGHDVLANCPECTSGIKTFLAGVFANTGNTATPTSAQRFSCDRLDAAKKTLLEDAGLTKCLFPFGTLVAADSRIPDSYVTQTAQIIAQYLDPNRDGNIDYTAVHAQWQNKGDWIPMPWDQNDWSQKEAALNQAIGYGMIAPRWWMHGAIQEQPNNQQRAMLFEEATHLFSARGLAYAFPTQFSLDTYDSSILSRETQKANCVFWHHPENDCPDRPGAVPGDCSDTFCNATEFLHGVMTVLNGVIATLNGLDTNPGTSESYGILLGNQALRDALSPDFMNMINDPKYGLPLDGFSFDYPLEKAL